MPSLCSRGEVVIATVWFEESGCKIICYGGDHSDDDAQGDKERRKKMTGVGVGGGGGGGGGGEFDSDGADGRRADGGGGGDGGDCSAVMMMTIS